MENLKQTATNICLFGFFLFFTFAVLNPNPFGNNPDAIADESYFLTSSLSAIEKHTLPGWEFSLSGNYYGGPQTYVDTIALIPALTVVMAFSGFSPLATKMWVAENTGELLHLLRLVNGSLALGTLVFFFFFFKKRKIPRSLAITLVLFLFLLLSNVLFIQMLHTAKVWVFYALIVSAMSALFIANEYYLAHFDKPFLHKETYLALLIWSGVLVFFQAIVAVFSICLLMLYAILLKHISIRDVWEYARKYWHLFFLFTLTQISFIYRAIFVNWDSFFGISVHTPNGQIDWLPRLYNPILFTLESHPLAVLLYLIGTLSVIGLILQKRNSLKNRYFAIAIMHPFFVYVFFHAIIGFSLAPRYAIILTIALSFSAAILISEISKRLAVSATAISGILFVIIGVHSIALYWRPSSETELLKILMEKYNSPDIAFVIEPSALRLSLPTNERSLSLLSERRKNMERFKFLSKHPDMLRGKVPFTSLVLTSYNEKEEREAFASLSASLYASSSVWSITTDCSSLCTKTETAGGQCFLVHADTCGFMPNEPNVLEKFLSFNQLGNAYTVRKVR